MANSFLVIVAEHCKYLVHVQCICMNGDLLISQIGIFIQPGVKCVIDKLYLFEVQLHLKASFVVPAAILSTLSLLRSEALKPPNQFFLW